MDGTQVVPPAGGVRFLGHLGRSPDSGVHFAKAAASPQTLQITEMTGRPPPLPSAPGDPNSAVPRPAGYRISWEVYGRNDSRLTDTLNSTTHEYKIQGLSSLTTYTIDVAALTAVGAGLATSSTISSGVPPGQ